MDVRLREPEAFPDSVVSHWKPGTPTPALPTWLCAPSKFIITRSGFEHGPISLERTTLSRRLYFHVAEDQKRTEVTTGSQPDY